MRENKDFKKITEEIKTTGAKAVDLCRAAEEYCKMNTPAADRHALDLLFNAVDCYNKLVGLYSELGRINAETVKKLEKLLEEQRLETKRRLNELRRLLGYKKLISDDKSNDEISNISSKDSECGKKNGGNHNKQGRRGAPEGHRGASRKVPDYYNREADMGLPEKCKCGCCNIVDTGETDVKYQEDIPPVVKIVTKLNYRIGKCSDCGKTVRHKDAVTGPPVKIGPDLMSHLSVLNQMGLSFGKLSSWTTNMLGIPLSPSGIYGIVKRTTDNITWMYELIGDLLPEQKVLFLDETGWKVAGVPWYIWVLCNSKMIYLHADKSRAGEVVRNIIGADYPGIGVCDFYGGYNAFSRTQRCLVHLMRDIEKELQIFPGNKKIQKLERLMWDFINTGLKAQENIGKKIHSKFCNQMENILDEVVSIKMPKGKPANIVKRINKYRNNIIRFAYHSEVEYHNNRAERSLRPMVISRKNSFGSNRPHGARRTAVLHSVVETLKLHNVNPLNFVKKANTDKTFRIHSFEELKAPILEI